MIARRETIALSAAALVAIGLPLVLLWPGPQAAPQPAAARSAPLAPPAQPPLASAFNRPLFAAAPSALVAEANSDAPALIGIVGRLDQDAVALVKGIDGASRTLKIGESVDGWKLESLALDAAFFTRGNERRRVPLPVE